MLDCGMFAHSSNLPSWDFPILIINNNDNVAAQERTKRPMGPVFRPTPDLALSLRLLHVQRLGLSF